jgi:predicted MPP superfamily phosphohydrolase
VDIAQRLGRAPLGPGPYRTLLRVPGNQIFQVEFSEKEFTATRLPDALAELRILHLSDFHFIGTVDRSFFREVCELAADTRPDLIAFTGDLLDNLKYIDWLPETLGRLDAPLGRYFILGNHDERVGPDPIREAMRSLGWTDLAGRAVTVDAGSGTEANAAAVRLLLAGTERPWMGHDPPATAAADFKILLSHTPDRIGWARKAGFDLMLSGHNHGGQVVLPVIGPVYSPSYHGVRYAAGSWWQPPTLLHVSRGLSGKHPLRLNCPPEVATLILTPPRDENGASALRRASQRHTLPQTASYHAQP